MKEKITESGWWNGLPAQITCCIIEVIATPEKPMLWHNAFAGQTRQVVEVSQDGTSFIIDNQHGDGFYKVNTGMGSPGCWVGSKHFGEFKLLEYVPPEYWNRILDEPQLAGESFIIEDYQERTNPEEFKKIQALVKGLRMFQAMSPEQQVDHIRQTMLTPAPAPRPNFPPGGIHHEGPARALQAPPSKQHHSFHKKDGKGKR